MGFDVMIADQDIWRAAHLLVKRYGQDAAIEAAQRVDAMLERGDIEEQMVWKRVPAAIVELQRTKSEPDEPMN
mgnify:CR=1 FL=1